MAGYTIAEKILGAHAGKAAHAGDIVICNIDRIMMHDANSPLAIRAFRNMGGEKVFAPEKVVVVFDHCTPPANEKLANIHAFIREFVKEQGTVFFEGGRGVCHQLMIEQGLASSGELVIGSDSHTCTYGAVGALSTGLGATDIATAMLTGKLWMKVPETIRVNLHGALRKGCSAKDIILKTIGILRADGANYQSVEFYGDYLESCGLSQRLTITNMLVEMGAKCGFTCCSDIGISADPGAEYIKTIDIDLSGIRPQIAKPHRVDNICDIDEVTGTTIDQAVLGSCTNGRVEDLLAAADILRGKYIAEGVRLLVLPASETVLKQAAENHVLSDLINAGAMICTPGCGVCVGTLGGVPADGETVISSTNRNFKGRMGNNKASIYLASPETVAASALYGYIADPGSCIEHSEE